MRLFKKYFQLKYNPVGVKITNFEEEADSQKLRFCEAVKLAANGKRILITRKNLDCFGAEMSLGFIKPVFGDIIRSIVVEQFNPNDDFDVVLIIADPGRIMKLSLVYSQLFREKMEAKFSGEKAVCGEATAHVILSGKPNISFLCHGARSYGKYGDDEVVIGIPTDIFRKICNHIEKKQIKSMCGCLTDDIPEHVVKRLEKIGFYKATDHFAGMFDGKIVKLHIFKGDDNTAGIFTSIKFKNEDKAERAESEFDNILSKNQIYIQRRENWLDLSKIIEFEIDISIAAQDGGFVEKLQKEISELIYYSDRVLSYSRESGQTD